jgi:hypothetical protein
MRELNGERFFHYSLPDGLDPDERNIAEKRLFERCGRVADIRDLRTSIHTLLVKLASAKDFKATYAGRKYPDDLWFGIHGRKHDRSDMGAFIQDPADGLFFRVGSFLANANPPPLASTYPQMVKNIASGASWEILARRRAEYSVFVRMEKVRAGMPIFGTDCAVDEGPPYYRFTISRYGHYPIHLVMRLEGWEPDMEPDALTIHQGKTCERLSVSNTWIDEDDKLADDILMQPVSWSALRVSGGDEIHENWAPRYLATLYSTRYLVTCAISEEQDRGGFVASAAVRNVTDGNLVALKRVNGENIEEAVENIRKRNAEIKKLEERTGEVYIMEREWDVLDTDPLASLMEIRNLPCWNSSVGHNTMAKRTSDIFG